MCHALLNLGQLLRWLEKVSANLPPPLTEGTHVSSFAARSRLRGAGRTPHAGGRAGVGVGVVRRRWWWRWRILHGSDVLLHAGSSSLRIALTVGAWLHDFRDVLRAPVFSQRWRQQVHSHCKQSCKRTVKWTRRKGTSVDLGLCALDGIASTRWSGL